MDQDGSSSGPAGGGVALEAVWELTKTPEEEEHLPFSSLVTATAISKKTQEHVTAEMTPRRILPRVVFVSTSVTD